MINNSKPDFLTEYFATKEKKQSNDKFVLVLTEEACKKFIRLMKEQAIAEENNIIDSADNVYITSAGNVAMIKIMGTDHKNRLSLPVTFYRLLKNSFSSTDYVLVFKAQDGSLSIKGSLEDESLYITQYIPFIVNARPVTSEELSPDTANVAPIEEEYLSMEIKEEDINIRVSDSVINDDCLELFMKDIEDGDMLSAELELNEAIKIRDAINKYIYKITGSIHGTKKQ